MQSDRKIEGNTEREALTSFVNLLISDSARGIDIGMMLAKMGEYYQADRAYVFEQNAQRTHVDNTYEWCEAGVLSVKDTQQDIPMEMLELWIEEFKRHGSFYLENSPEYAIKNPGMSGLMTVQHVTSLMIAPMTLEGKIVGFIGVDNPKVHTDQLLMLSIIAGTLFKEILHDRESRLIMELKRTRNDIEHINVAVARSGIGIWGIYGFEEEHMAMHATPQMLEIMGAPQLGLSDEEIYDFWYSRIYPQDMPSVEASVQEMLDGIHSENTYRWKHPTKGITFVRCGGVAIHSTTGQVFLQGYHSDVTELVRKERAAADAQKEQLEQIQSLNRELEDNLNIFANAGYGIWKIRLCEDGHHKMMANDKLQEIFGIQDMFMGPEELYQYYHARLYESPADIESDDYADMMRGATRSRLLVWDHPTKGAIYLRAGGTCYSNKNGELIISGYCGDVSEQKLSEDYLSAKLEEAKQQAERANLAKTEFLFHMSHDIRTPMNAIIGYTDLMEHYRGDEGKFDDYLGKIRSSSQVLLSLINNVLEMARIESGKAVLEEEAIDIEEFFNNMCVVVEEQMREKNIRFAMRMDVEHTYLMCDMVKCRQIVLNILSNACKYTAENGHVSMQVKEIPYTNPEYACIQVIIEDDGIGMSQEFIPRIFDEFSRERTVTDTKIEGTGLGMPIVKRIIDLMGGSIMVDSELGKGSKFIVTVCHKIAKKKEVAEHKHFELDPTRFIGKRLLLAEDNDMNAEIAVELLSAMGMTVDRVENGKQCVEALQEAPAGIYDAILMDIQMPEMDGYQATQIIRAMNDPIRQRIPILAMTANAFEEDRNKAIRVGMNEHIAKPIYADELAQTLTRVLGE